MHLINMRYKGRHIPVLLAALLVIVGCSQTKSSPETDSLMRAAREGHADAVKELLTTPGIDVNAKDADGNTALLEAARLGHDRVVRVLLATGANVNARDKYGKTPLMLAVSGDHEEVIAALKQAGARE